MPVTSIYLTRHGFRGQFNLDLSTKTYSSRIKSPTAIPNDPPLTAYGEQQAEQLGQWAATARPPVSKIYSSPYYRCLQTVAPTALRLGLPVHGDYGLGEWFGLADFSHPSPAGPDVLGSMFPSFDPSYQSSPAVCANGESVEHLYDRCARAMAYIIQHAERDHPGEEVAILICTHAAPLIAMGRVLTGVVPDEVTERDFHTFTCGITLFERRSSEQHLTMEESHEALAIPDWGNGEGVAGGWNCVSNGDCSHLAGGGERAWYFTGDEAFTHVMKVEDGVTEQEPGPDKIGEKITLPRL